MSVHLNRDDVPREPLPGGGTRRRLIDGNTVAGTRCRFDLVTLDAGGSLELRNPGTGVTWALLLEGSVSLHGAGDSRRLGKSQVLFLSGEFDGRLDSEEGAALIFLAVPDARRLDPSLQSARPAVHCIELDVEPMLQSEHDERTRIYVATPRLFGTKAVVGELVAFPPGTVSQNHHHVGAEHFQYILRGDATVYLNETPRRIRAGDLLYKYGGEPSRHIATHTSDGSIYADV